jgi:hypothetical protein
MDPRGVNEGQVAQVDDEQLARRQVGDRGFQRRHRGEVQFPRQRESRHAAVLDQVNRERIEVHCARLSGRS